MLKYCLTAGALKFFSCTPASRWFYRTVVGNGLGNRQRVKQGLHRAYVEHASVMLANCRKYNALTDGARCAEIGTGWMHFYAIFLRLFYDLRITLVDAWDNRQLPGLKKFFGDLDNVLDDLDLTAEDRSRAHRILSEIAKVGSFDELYELLGFEYVIDPTLSTLEAGSYDLLFSEGVLEHVLLTDLPEQIANMARVMKPGAMQHHHIGIADHLAHYDRSASPKQYITYSDRKWRILFENGVQYINRLQPSEFRNLFTESGMIVLDESHWDCKIDHLKVNDRFRGYSEDDLKCGGDTLVMQKPA